MPKYVLNKSWHYNKGAEYITIKKRQYCNNCDFPSHVLSKKSFKKHLCEFVQKSEGHI